MTGWETGEKSSRLERFRELYDAAYPRLMAYARRRAANQEDALDAVSETFIVLWRRLDDVPPGPRAVPWIYGVARRVLANQYRSRDRRAQLEHRLADNRASGAGDTAFEAVHEALDRLRPDDREMLTLSAWDDLDNDEIAEVLGIPARNVAVRMHRARKRLERELAGTGSRSPRNPSNSVKSERDIRTPNRVNGTLPGPGEVETP